MSIARAFVNLPPVILADESTESLDSEHASAVVRILNQTAVQYHTAFVVVTHDKQIVRSFRRVCHIRDGRTHEEAGESSSL